MLVFSSSHVPLYSASVKPVDSPSTKELRLDQVTLPDDLGKIHESYLGTAKETVILIQDAHAIPDAQKNIQRLIAHFQKEYGVDLVALEGASAKLDSQIFKSFPDKEALQKVFQEYHKRGELAGGVAAAIFSATERGGSAKNSGGNEMIFQGIEDWKLYEEGIGLYLQAMEKTPEILKGLEARSSKLEEEKKKIYSKELLELDKILKDFYQNHGYFLEALQKLAAIQPPVAESELALLFQESKAVKDNSTIAIEVKRIAELVGSSLRAPKGRSNLGTEIASSSRLGGTPRNDELLRSFNQKYQEFQTSRITAVEFALWMDEQLSLLCHPEGRRPEGSKNVDSSACGLRMTKALFRSIKNQKRLQDIKGTKLFEDFEHYAKDIKEGLIKNNDERTLDRESENLRLLERFARLELSHKDWKELNGKIIPSLRAPQGRSNLGDRFVASLLAMTEAHFFFYTTAKKREQAFFVNLQNLMKKEKREKALVVLGGFHAEGLTETFKKQGISYLLLTPQIDSLPEQSNYQSHMRGDVSWKDYFEAENGRVNLYNAFVRGTRDRLLASSKSDKGLLLKSWRDEIIRDLAEKEEIANAHKYTSFIDEVAGKNREDSWRSKWLANIDKFMDTLDQLDLSGQLNEQNVLKFFQPSTTISTAGAVLTDASVAAPIVKGWGGAALMRFRGETPTALSSPASVVTNFRSEARSTPRRNAPLRSGQSAETTGVGLSSPKSEARGNLIKRFTIGLLLGAVVGHFAWLTVRFHESKRQLAEMDARVRNIEIELQNAERLKRIADLNQKEIKGEAPKKIQAEDVSKAKPKVELPKVTQKDWDELRKAFDKAKQAKDVPAMDKVIAKWLEYHGDEALDVTWFRDFATSFADPAREQSNFEELNSTRERLKKEGWIGAFDPIEFAQRQAKNKTLEEKFLQAQKAALANKDQDPDELARVIGEFMELHGYEPLNYSVLLGIAGFYKERSYLRFTLRFDPKGLRFFSEQIVPDIKPHGLTGDAFILRVLEVSRIEEQYKKAEYPTEILIVLEELAELHGYKLIVKDNFWKDFARDVTQPKWPFYKLKVYFNSEKLARDFKEGLVTKFPRSEARAKTTTWNDYVYFDKQIKVETTYQHNDGEIYIFFPQGKYMPGMIGYAVAFRGTEKIAEELHNGIVATLSSNESDFEAAIEAVKQYVQGKGYELGSLDMRGRSEARSSARTKIEQEVIDRIEESRMILEQLDWELYLSEINNLKVALGHLKGKYSPRDYASALRSVESVKTALIKHSFETLTGEIVSLDTAVSLIDKLISKEQKKKSRNKGKVSLPNVVREPLIYIPPSRDWREELIQPDSDFDGKIISGKGYRSFVETSPGVRGMWSVVIFVVSGYDFKTGEVLTIVDRQISMGSRYSISERLKINTQGGRNEAIKLHKKVLRVVNLEKSSEAIMKSLKTQFPQTKQEPKSSKGDGNSDQSRPEARREKVGRWKVEDKRGIKSVADDEGVWKSNRKQEPQLGPQRLLQKLLMSQPSNGLLEADKAPRLQKRIPKSPLQVQSLLTGKTPERIQKQGWQQQPTSQDPLLISQETHGDAGSKAQTLKSPIEEKVNISLLENQYNVSNYENKPAKRQRKGRSEARAELGAIYERFRLQVKGRYQIENTETRSSVTSMGGNIRQIVYDKVNDTITIRIQPFQKKSLLGAFTGANSADLEITFGPTNTIIQGKTVTKSILKPGLLFGLTFSNTPKDKIGIVTHENFAKALYQIVKENQLETDPIHFMTAQQAGIQTEVKRQEDASKDVLIRREPKTIFAKILEKFLERKLPAGILVEKVEQKELAEGVKYTASPFVFTIAYNQNAKDFTKVKWMIAAEHRGLPQFNLTFNEDGSAVGTILVPTERGLRQGTYDGNASFIEMTVRSDGALVYVVTDHFFEWLKGSPFYKLLPQNQGIFVRLTDVIADRTRYPDLQFHGQILSSVKQQREEGFFGKSFEPFVEAARRGQVRYIAKKIFMIWNLRAIILKSD